MNMRYFTCILKGGAAEEGPPVRLREGIIFQPRSVSPKILSKGSHRSNGNPHDGAFFTLLLLLLHHACTIPPSRTPSSLFLPPHES
ncbi:hypothetical protein Naga_101478g1 [Nannochloropsis gaditana]|uniref:Uncharacterized protein n=1 Tax=Nannochloropsis gaditana TaxID=72520 RepID=W7SZ69_9STRA|nr:hypothetical protein Naga_101478g1 [Nannochloropsis gaditana]